MSQTHSKFRPLTITLTLCSALLLSQVSLAEKSNTQPMLDTQAKQPTLQLKQAAEPNQNNAQPGFAPVFQIPFRANCASGFSLAKEDKNGNGWTDWYVCTTPVISCPKQTQPDNGKTSTVHPTVVLQTIGGNPDGGEVSFRIQYKCDYGWTATPAG